MRVLLTARCAGVRGRRAALCGMVRRLGTRRAPASPRRAPWPFADCAPACSQAADQLQGSSANRRSDGLPSRRIRRRSGLVSADRALTRSIANGT